MTDISTPAKRHEPSEPTPDLARRALATGKSLFVIFLYLYVVFALFNLHEYVILTQHGIPFTHLGVALANALVLSKVVLLAEDLRLGRFLEDYPLAYLILGKSGLFAAVMIAFRMLEHILVAAWQGRPVADSLPLYSQAGIVGLLAVVVTLTVILVPFFAVRELRRVTGGRQLYALMFRSDWKRVVLEIKPGARR